MLQLSTYFDYSFRVLMYAALRSPDWVTVSEIAESFGISCHHLSKVVHHLGRSGYLETHRGIRGGFTLARPPEEIRLGDILRIRKETSTVIACVDKANRPCRILPVCRLKGMLNEAVAAFFEVMDRYTLADLMKDASQVRTVLQAFELTPSCPLPSPLP